MNKYDGVGLPKDGDYIDLRIVLKKNVQTYKDKATGEDKSFISYAQVGSKFGGSPIGDGTLAFKLTIYPQAVKKANTSVQVI